MERKRVGFNVLHQGRFRCFDGSAGKIWWTGPQTDIQTPSYFSRVVRLVLDTIIRLYLGHCVIPYYKYILSNGTVGPRERFQKGAYRESQIPNL